MNDPFRVLTRASSGPEVSRLQGDLLSLDLTVAPTELSSTRFGPATRRAVLAFQQKHMLLPTGAVDELTTETLQDELADHPVICRIFGQVRFSDGQPAPEVVVRAYDRDLRREELLGEERTDKQGYYQISYTPDRFARAEKASADLLLRVTSDEQVVYDPPRDQPLFNAPQVVVINIDLPGGASRPESEYERLLKAISPLLDGVPLDGLQEDGQAADLTFLAGETGIPLSQLSHFAVAQQLATRYDLPAEFFYALFAQNTLIRAGLIGAAAVRFDVDLATEQRALYYDIVLLPEKTISGAVRQAVKRDIVSSALLDRLDAVLRQLQGGLPEAQRYVQEQGPKSFYAQMERLLQAGAESDVLAVLQGESAGDLPEIIGRLQGAFQERRSTEAGSTRSMLAEVLGYDAQILGQVQTIQALERPEDLQQLARLNRAEWKTTLQRAASTLQVGGEPIRAELLDLHASALVRKLEQRYPTTAFSAQLERDPVALPEQRDTLLGLAATHPDFNLASSNLETLLRTTPGLMAGPGADAVKEALKATQRVFKVAPIYRQTRALLSRGVRSAADVQAMGETRFVREFVATGQFNRLEARTAYRKASDLHAASMLLAGELQAAAGANTVSALSLTLPPAKLQAVTQDFPNMRSLFGLADSCECQDCRSVHSASAYLVDTLQFLKHRLVVDTTAPGPGTSVKIAKDVLFGRRPDLGDTDLSCDNTNIPLPYLDLVCELLEEAVAPDPGVPFAGAVATGVVAPDLLAALQGGGLAYSKRAVVSEPDAAGNRTVRDLHLVCKLQPDGAGGWTVRPLRQTFGTAEERAAAPAYVNATAYTRLQSSRIAFRLPFDLAHQETRSYFAGFDVSRSDLMRALQTPVGPLPAEIAAETLGLSHAERQLIVTPDPGGQNGYWNTGATPASDLLKVVETFLDRSELSYAQLTELLAQTWVNPGGTLFIRHLDSSCDLTRQEIEGLNAGALDRLHRFTRLWKKVGWSAADLDRFIRSANLGASHMDDVCLEQLVQLQEVQRRLGLATAEAINLYAALTTEGEGSRYAQVFLNPAANGSVNEDFQPANLTLNEQAELNVPGSGKKLALYAADLALALGLTAADIGRLLNTLGTDTILGLAGLSALYALARLAKTLKLPVGDLLTLGTLTGIDPLAAPAATLRFLAALSTVRAAGITLSDLRYLLTHTAEQLSDHEFSDTAIAQVLTALQARYHQAFLAARSPLNPDTTADENKAPLKALLGTLVTVTEADLARFDRLVDAAWTDPLPTISAFIDQMFGAAADTAQVKALAGSLPADAATLVADRSVLAAAQDALAVAVTPAQTAAAAAQVTAATAQMQAASGQLEKDRLALMLALADLLSTRSYAAAKEAALLTATAAALRLTDDVAGVLLRQGRLQQSPAPLPRTFLDLLTDDVIVPPPPAALPTVSALAFDLQFRALRSLHTTALLIRPSRLTAAELTWLLGHALSLGWLSLDNLTYEVGTAPVSFGAWAEFQEAVGFLRVRPAVDNPADPERPFTAQGMFEQVVAPGAIVGDVLGTLSALTGWDTGVLTALDQRLGFSVPDLTAYKRPGTFQRLEEAVTLLRRLGVDIPTAVSLSGQNLSLANAAQMRQALKAKYAEEEWLGALKGMQDRLREQKRDALVAFLLANNPGFTGPDDLYDYFLIDVEMGACMPTSRIVQAHATVQLFVQRCLMGLEPRSVANVKEDSAWTQWKWMANYRVWEANRKVFLYPENWIEPELRDNKSELFLNFENTLQQNELSDQAVLDAAGTYLEQLDDVAQMDVMATYYQTDLGTLHVFARTKGGDPVVYYYRQFRKEREWTPWEKVDLDIAGDHLLAFDRNSRLTLAWPVFTEETETPTDVRTPNPAEIPSGGQPTQQPNRRWKIQLAVSERVGGKWRPRKVSKEALYSPGPDVYFSVPPPAAETYNFFVWGSGAAQAVACTNVGAGWIGSFALTGCRGYPEPRQGGGLSLQLSPQFKDARLLANRFTEQRKDATDDLAIWSTFSSAKYDTIVNQTPGTFKVTHPMQMTLIDWLLLALQQSQAAPKPWVNKQSERVSLPLGTFMPYFYGDIARTYTIVPGFYERPRTAAPRGTKKTFSDIDQLLRDLFALIGKYLPGYLLDPARDLTTLIKAVITDPEYARLEQEFHVYQGLQFGLRFENFYHPLICFLRAILNRSGFRALMDRDVQLTDTGFDFGAVYGPTPLVASPYPRENIDFDLGGAYAGYNWELFFHTPFEIASKLSQDQRFEEARTWFHLIFNPVGATDAPAPQKYWVTKPFFQTTGASYLAQRIDDIMYAVAADPSGATISQLKFAVEEWRDHPFSPHVIARSRPVAYQLAVLRKYIQNLVDWGDSLFRQFTRESVTQATQLYILADKLLGPKPRAVPPLVTPPTETYNQLEAKVDLFGNALLDLENLIPDLGLLPHGGAELPPAPMTLSALYFCIPPNETMLRSWDLIADRLFKIRHCQNIDGVESILALFSPPIDPGALVRAAAAGVDPGAFIAGLGAPLPHYRFSVMAQKATELISQVGVLGAALLAALEKKDAEALGRLRSTQEISLLTALRNVKLAAITEAGAAAEGLNRSRKVTEERRSYYQNQSYMNTWEIAATTLSGLSLIGEAAAAIVSVFSGGAKLVPQFSAGIAGFGGTPFVTVTTGGQSVGSAADSAATVLTTLARLADKGAGMAATQGNYQRRQDEWDFQVRMADKELSQIDQQIATAKLHIEMLTADLTAHDQQSTNARQTDNFMHSKYTNRELYDWMTGQISAVYFQAYRLAFDTAKKAERCFQHELGSSDSFLNFGYWNSLKKGLMSAEALNHDLKRMEVAYLDQNRREYELTKHLSLRQLDPAALIQLRATGKCLLQVPETVFDLDHPGQYRRRIKSVSLSVPCVAGPYTSVSCKLSLVSNRYRKNTELRQGVASNKEKYQEQPGNDDRFAYNIGTIESIATSTGQSDSGLFELNFRDERYLPFEGLGAIGTWQLELPAAFRQFDYDSISDAVLHLKYTARDGGSGFRALVEGVSGELLNDQVLAAGREGLYQAYDLRTEFPDQWARLKQTASAQLTVGAQYLPYAFRSHAPAIDRVTWFAKVTGEPAGYAMAVNAAPFTLHRNATLAQLCVGTSANVTLGTTFDVSAVDPSQLEALTLMVHYTISP